MTLHLGLVFRTTAVLLVVVSLFMVFPIAFALSYGETATIKFFLIPMGAAFLVAGALLIGFRSRAQKINARDGFLLVSVSWVAASAIGCLPFYLSGAIPRLADAYFETMSGFTTTGASILGDIESLPKSMLFWRSLTHWLGGMGIVVLTTAILPLLGIGAFRLIKAEAPGPSLDKITPRIVQTAKILWLIYLGLSVAETALLMVGGMSLFDALTHTFGTLATGGFSTKQASVGHYNSGYIDVVITVFMILAGLNFALYFWLLTGKVGRVLRNVEARAYLAIFAVATIIIAVVLYRTTYAEFDTSLRYAGFQAATILTTTGYVTTDYEAWPHAAQIVLFVLMFIGGSSGSTGGGIKVIRIVVLAKLAANEMRVLSHPHGVFSIRLGGEPLKKGIVYTIGGFFFMYIFMLLLTAGVVASAGNDILTSFAAALVTLGNIGPGFGRIGPVGNYAYLPDYVKWFLSFVMMAGRLELYTVIAVLTPTFWRR